MKNMLLFFIFFNLVFANQSNLKEMSLIELFNNKHYSYICKRRWEFINKYNNIREDLLSLVAYSCLKKRYITPALDLAKVLKVTKEGRKNATYIITLFLMKKFIMQIINDNFQIGEVKLPTINDNSLGVLFQYIQDGKFKKEQNHLVVFTNNKKYIIYISQKNNVVVETYFNGALTKREYYW